MTSDIKNEVRHFIIEELEWPGDSDQLGDGVSLIDEGVLDSLNLLELAHFLQSHYRIRVEDIDVVAQNFETLDAIEAFVASRLPTSSSPVAQ
ncbi:acyl carrier protein [Couchioplanes caeruleus]|uniref:Acyl carrier protein n=1 Tax=Couchioplanes caeruleus TaxID=56438 RepID=A0A3N1GM56_9ACTN|nr:acyl carrier protein [Couchioplanes caeruleus]ROP31354.1 acyl carrier protein [Couchioplanes caeruleus]